MTTATLANMVTVAFTSETEWLLDSFALTKVEFIEGFPGVKAGDTFKALLPDGTVKVVESYTHSSWSTHVRLDVQSEQDWQREQDA